MPQGNVWIRKENWEKWQELPNKSDFINSILEEKESLPIPAPRENFTPVATQPRTPAVIRSEIAAIEAELASTVNQDPDYWASMNETKQELWNEYHAAKGA